MPESFTDITDSFDAPWYIDIDPYTSVAKVLQGTFCFPFGRGFGCGESYEHSNTEELSLSASVSAEKSGISGGIEIGIKHSEGDKWSYVSEKCEYCRPRICFPDSTLAIYEFRHSVVFIPLPLTSTITDFTPGPQGEIERNCTQNDPLCKCSEEQAAFFSEGGSTEASPALYSLLLTPTGWRVDLDDPGEVDTGKLALVFGGILDAMFETFANRPGRRPELGIRTPRGETVWLTGRPSGPTIALLSRDACEYQAGRGPAWIRGKNHHAVFATGCDRKLEAQASLFIALPDGESKTFQAEIQESRGIATVIATHFDLGPQAVPPGSRAILRLDLRDPSSGCVVDSFREELQVPVIETFG